MSLQLQCSDLRAVAMATELAARVQHQSEGRVRTMPWAFCRSFLCCFTVLRTPFSTDNLERIWSLMTMAEAVRSECYRSRQGPAANQLLSQDDMKGFFLLATGMQPLRLAGFFLQGFLFCSSFNLESLSNRSYTSLTQLFLSFYAASSASVIFSEIFCFTASIYPDAIRCQLLEGSSLCCHTGILLHLQTKHHTGVER